MTRGTIAFLLLLCSPLTTRAAKTPAPPDSGAAPADCAAGRSEVPPSTPRLTISAGDIDLHMQSADVKDVYLALGKAAGIKVLFDPEIREKKTDADFSHVTFESAMAQLGTANEHSYQPLDDHTVIVIPDNMSKHRQYDELAIRTFYLCHAPLNETQELVQRVLNTRFMSTTPSLRALTIRDTVDNLSIAGRLIEAVDKPRGEIALDVTLAGDGLPKGPIGHLRVSDGERAVLELPDPRAASRTIAVSARVEASRSGDVHLVLKMEQREPPEPGQKDYRVLARLETATNVKDGESETFGPIGDLSLSITPHVVRIPVVTDKDLEPLYVGTEFSTSFKASR
ncbi:MAG: hypothetical protein U0166_04290 [Acidobacteriota bacterium]